MSELEIILRLLAGIGLIASNGYFVTTEFAMTRVRQFPKESFQENRSSSWLGK